MEGKMTKEEHMEYILASRVQMLEQIKGILMSAPLILLSLSCHEFAHAAMSDRLGDPTPRREGRLSLNPFRHLDLKGLVCLLVFHFGWAKPVMINPRYYKNRRQAMILVAAAGPMMNFFLALSCLFVFTAGSRYFPASTPEIVYDLLLRAVYLNLGLGVFNLIPIPPLDGSKILSGILPSLEPLWRRIERYGMVILLVLIFSGAVGGLISRVSQSIVLFFFEIFRSILW